MTDRLLSMLYQYLLSNQSLELDRTFQIYFKVLSIDHSIYKSMIRWIFLHIHVLQILFDVEDSGSFCGIVFACCKNVKWHNHFTIICRNTQVSLAVECLGLIFRVLWKCFNCHNLRGLNIVSGMELICKGFFIW